LSFIGLYFIPFQTSKPYWPTKEEPVKTYGPIEVTLQKTNDESNVDSVYIRDFFVKPVKAKVNIMHFRTISNVFLAAVYGCIDFYTISMFEY
jgi:hypothetical protein